MPANDSPTATAFTRWRTLDIVTCAVLAVAFGVVFWAWNFVWTGLEPALAFLLPLKGILYGVWLIPAVLAPLIVRKAGAGVFTEALAAVVSALMGSFWGVLVIYQGLVQGLGGELVFAAGRYRRFGTGIAAAAGATACCAATVWDLFAYYQNLDFWAFQLPYVAFAMVSGAVIAGLGSKALVAAMLPTGVLDSFPAGRERTRI
ncbi:ECF transporter S component [Glycomyces salinus]|uniref:ECF transporter S component n=1 Tax=Glycomyces salinus TaxID=980294 RepID=UPI0018EE176E|nr:ECF transporter S component [Glycomyces salinus]